MKLKELRKKLALLSLTTSLLFSTGCSNLENTRNTNTTTENNTTEIEKQVSTELSEEDLKKLELQEYKDFFDNFQINYKIEDYLITDEEIDQIISNANTKKECDFKWDKDSDSLQELIRNNSYEYVQNHPEFQDGFLECDDEEVNASFWIALGRAIDSLKDSTNNINEDACRMQTLKIVVGNIDDDSTLAYYDDEENLIVISIDNIKSRAKVNGIDFKQSLFYTLKHEINHVRELSCDCRLKKGDQILSIDYQDVISFLDEAPAESELYNYNLNKIDYYNSYYYTYPFERNGEALLFVPILMENKNIDEYYNAIFDSDINSFCKFFNAKTPDEIKDLYKIIYCIDSTFNRSDFSDKYFDEDKSYPGTYGELEEAIGYDYKTQIFKTALQNLINYTENNEDISLKDNLILLNIIRNTIMDGSYIVDKIQNKEYRFKIDKSFFEDVKNLNDKYIEYLCSKYNVSKEDIDYLSIDIDLAIYDIEHYSCCEYDKCDDYSYTKDFCKKFPLIEVFCRNLDFGTIIFNVLEKENIEYYDNDKEKTHTYNTNQ